MAENKFLAYVNIVYIEYIFNSNLQHEFPQKPSAAAFLKFTKRFIYMTQAVGMCPEKVYTDIELSI